MKFDDDHKQEWEELEFDEPGAKIEKDTSVEDQVDEAVQKLVRETIGVIPGNAYDTSEEERKEEAPGGSEADDEEEYEAEDDDEEYEYEDDDEDDEENPRRKGGKKGLLAFGIAAALVVVLLAGFYGYRAFYYTSHFFDGTVINGMDCSDKTVEQVERQIEETAKTYALDIQFRNGEQQILGSSIDYRYQPDGGVQALLNQQSAFAWLLENSKSKKHEVSVQMQYDAAKLEEQVSQFPQLQEDQMEAPADARIDFTDGKFVATESSQGTKLDVAKAKEAITLAVTTGALELDMEEAGVYQEPAVSLEDSGLEEQAATLNELVSASIIYQLPGGQTKVLDGTMMKDWLSVDENGSYSKNEEVWNQKLGEFVAGLAAEVDTYGKEQTFPATGIDGGVKVTQSNYGWKIDQEQEIAQLSKDISEHLTTTREPVYASKEFAQDNNGFGNTYVEIDISRQHVWFYKDGSRIVDSECVSGKMVKSRYTPSGIFTLVSKTSPKTLRGPKKADGSYEWESDVTFWMPFNGGIGLHDATWRSSFGGNIYKNSGSHGCINLPYNVAKTIYNNIEVGTPIIVYYSNSYTVRDDSAEREAENLPTSATVTDPTSTPSPSATQAPTATARPTQAPTTTARPTQTPTTTPTETPTTTPEPTDTPATTPEPTDTPTPEPTQPQEPTEPPATPSPEPSDTPDGTPAPTEAPDETPQPTEAPASAADPTAAPETAS